MLWITEVAPRDGLQNEPRPVPTPVKVAFINALARTGVQEVEVSSFVSPRWVPQLADAEEVFARIARVPGVVYSALVPNMKGLERALGAGVDKIAVFTAASETFNRKNTNATIAESIARFRDVVARAREAGLTVRGYISTAFYCPFEGKIPPRQVLPVVEQLLDVGVDEVDLADTIGRAVPRDIRALLQEVLRVLPPERVALHVHDTYGMGVANVLTAYETFGITRFDSSAGGLGGCPFAPGATGNVATEDIVYALRMSGAPLSVSLKALKEAVKIIQPHLDRPIPSRLWGVLQTRQDLDDVITQDLTADAHTANPSGDKPA